MESEDTKSKTTGTSGTSAIVRPKQLGMPSYMRAGSGINRAFEVISGINKDERTSDSDLPFLDSAKEESIAAQPPVSASSSEDLNEKLSELAIEEKPVDNSKVVEKLTPKEGAITKSTSRKAADSSSSGAANSDEKPKASPLAKGKEDSLLLSEDTFQYNIKINLDPDQVLLLETFCFQLRLKVMKKFKRKPSIGLQTLSQFFLTQLVADKSYLQKFEEDFMNQLSSNQHEKA